jgi:hypothetical protein
MIPDHYVRFSDGVPRKKHHTCKGLKYGMSNQLRRLLHRTIHIFIDPRHGKRQAG